MPDWLNRLLGRCPEFHPVTGERRRDGKGHVPPFTLPSVPEDRCPPMPRVKPPTELLRCPFCGKVPEPFPNEEYEGRGYGVLCVTPGCAATRADWPTRAEANAAWNTRCASK